jgi:hypothetical protein
MTAARDRLRDPVVRGNALQVVKTVGRGGARVVVTTRR